MTQGHKGQNDKSLTPQQGGKNNDFVLDSTIFSAVFERDIRRVYLYKKAERLAKAVHLISPAFASSAALKDRADGIAVALVDGAILPPAEARAKLSRELLALSSVLAIARAGGHLSPMNADLIAREAELLLHEVASYEPPRIFLDDAPSLSGLSRKSTAQRALSRASSQGHIKDIKDRPQEGGRRDAVLSVIREKGSVYIKDISGVVRGVSEKTIQRELAGLVKEGVVAKQGERRWTLYSLA